MEQIKRYPALEIKDLRCYMEIKLLNPVNNSVVEILPELQNEILASLPTGDTVVENSFDWRAPVAHDKENTTPRFINFCWGFEGSLAYVWSIELRIADNPEFDNADKYNINPGQAFLSINNFKRDTVYFWKMIAYGSEGPLYESPINTFKTSDALPQWYKVSGVTNLRDIGGWKTLDKKNVKEGLIFRGSEIGFFGDTYDAVNFFKDKLNIKTEVDLRFGNEITPFNKKITDADYHIFNILAYNLIDTDEQKEKYRDIFKIFAKPDSYPVYLHCVAGADRTGTVVALLKAMLDVSPDDIATDYELTTLCPFGARSRRQEAYSSFTKFLLSYGDTLKSGAENYLLSCGVTEEEIETIKRILTA